ncbi:MAG: molybdopterin-dependent oxidoreductase [Chloroflexota bacterium]|nr:MAG: molybdopterin-dependent oxidoreductase [Chloroflexota bacterium]
MPTEDNRFAKDTKPFIIHDNSLESRPEDLDAFITPNERFFVCNTTGTPRIDPDTYRLQVLGDAIKRPLTLTLAQIYALPKRSLTCYLECAGNGRRLFEEVHGTRPYGNINTMWMMGGVGNAAWEGVSLGSVLEMTGVKPNAVDVNIQGLDQDAPEGGTNRPIPIEKALQPDTLLAYRMNGRPLPADHGFPLRAIVPGWIGTNSIKWVGSITVSSARVWVRRNTEMYVLYGPEWPPEEHAPALGGPVATQNIKSSLALPYPARLAEGTHRLRGIARSPHGPITQVLWSADGGQSWSEANLLPPILPHAWTCFDFEWTAERGHHSLMTRATDAAGNIQPMDQPFNQEGYLFNMVYPHKVTVIPR